MCLLLDLGLLPAQHMEQRCCGAGRRATIQDLPTRIGSCEFPCALPVISRRVKVVQIKSGVTVRSELPAAAAAEAGQHRDGAWRESGVPGGDQRGCGPDAHAVAGTRPAAWRGQRCGAAARARRCCTLRTAAEGHAGAARSSVQAAGASARPTRLQQLETPAVAAYRRRHLAANKHAMAGGALVYALSNQHQYTGGGGDVASQ